VVCMPTLDTLLSFTLVAMAVMLVPGPSNLFLLAHGIAYGRASALAATSGIAAASAIRVVLAAAGLSAVLTSSAVAFDIVRWAGVGYLAYLGQRAFTSRTTARKSGEQIASLPRRRSARKGLLIGLGNPKMVIFYLALLPQFVQPGRGSQAVQILVLGTVIWAIGTIWDLAFACVSGTIGTWLESRPRRIRVQPAIEGVTYLALAAWAATTGERNA
jgi:threonine/homoserine/homoserine lactone efflux protein